MKKGYIDPQNPEYMVEDPKSPYSFICDPKKSDHLFWKEVITQTGLISDDETTLIVFSSEAFLHNPINLKYLNEQDLGEYQIYKKDLNSQNTQSKVTTYSLNHRSEHIKRYKLNDKNCHKELGHGSFGVVFECSFDNSTSVAVKNKNDKKLL